MFLIREVLSCKPGQVKEMVAKFRALSAVMERMDVKPFRLYTDVSGERFWTLVAELEVERLDDATEIEERVMANPEAQAAMSGYHELIERGRREIYRIEA